MSFDQSAKFEQLYFFLRHPILPVRASGIPEEMKIVTLLLNFPHVYGVTTDLIADVLDAFIICGTNLINSTVSKLLDFKVRLYFWMLRNTSVNLIRRRS
jgi:hypothetical protein